MNKNISHNITALRGIAALSIIIYHYVSIIARQYNMGTKFRYFDFGWLTFGVPMFFVLSAMFLYKKTYDIKNPVKLMVYRLVRLYPAYWIAVTITFFVRYVLMKDDLTIIDYLANLTMIEDLVGVQQLDGVYWTMTYEIMLLLIMSIITLIRSISTRMISTNMMCGIWLGLGIVGQFLMKIFGINSSSVRLLLFGSSYISVFVIGMILHDVYMLRGGGQSKGYLINIIVAIIYEIVFMPLSTAGIAIFAAILVWGVMSGWIDNLKINKVLFNSTMVWIGTISYPLYLCHRYIGEFFASFVVQDTPYLLALLLMIISFVISVGLAICISQLEHRMINRIKLLKIYKKIMNK